MRIKLILTMIIMFLFCFASTAPADEINNRVVALVNNDIITLYELNNRIKELYGQSSDAIKAQDEDTFIELRRQTLENMIDEKIAQAKAKELEIQVSQEEVDSSIEGIKKANKLTQEDLIASLKQQGLTYEAFRKSIKDDLERNQLIDYYVKQKSVILEGQLLKYYQDHPDEFKEEEKLKISGIFLMLKNKGNPDELDALKKKGEAILARIKSGEDFSSLAKEFSEGPGADEGGELGEFKAAEIEPTLKKIIDGLSDGNVSSLITTENGVQIIKLIKREGGTITPFDDIRDKIYETIYNEELNKRYITWIKDLRDSTYTKINF
jgi:peptidyl-prolyl cis-trans isomerase SurA